MGSVSQGDEYSPVIPGLLPISSRTFTSLEADTALAIALLKQLSISLMRLVAAKPQAPP